MQRNCHRREKGEQCRFCAAEGSGKMRIQNLNSSGGLHWRMYREGDKEDGRLPASVPGSVYQDLIANGKMEDPYYRDNELKALKIMENDFTYETHFAVPKELRSCRRVLLHFEGIDTLADIFLNLKKKGITILMVSHDIEFCASYGDVCAMFFDGGIVMEQDARTFFSGNSFYTTAANKMARQVFPDAVTVKDVIELCRANGI